MGSKLGRVIALEGIGASSVRLVLSTGEHVEVPSTLAPELLRRDPELEVLFVERRSGFLGSSVTWVGTASEARDAVAQGALNSSDLPSTIEAAIAREGQFLRRAVRPVDLSELKPDYGTMSVLAAGQDPLTLLQAGLEFRDLFFEAGDVLWALLHASGAADDQVQFPTDLKSSLDSHQAMVHVAMWMALHERGSDLWPRIRMKPELKDFGEVTTPEFAYAFATAIDELLAGRPFSVSPRTSYDVVMGGRDARFDQWFEALVEREFGRVLRMLQLGVPQSDGDDQASNRRSAP